MRLFTKQGQTLMLAATVAFLSTGAFAQTDEALVPFVVNVAATVRAVPGVADGELEPVQITVAANQEAIMRLPLVNAIGVLYEAQKQTNVPAIVNNRGGKITVNLQAQSYKNAEISLYMVNGKRILRNKVSASNAVNRISRPNVATGVYLLSVRGTDGNAITSRLAHKGGGLNINVVFGNGSENHSVTPKMTKKAADVDWTITVSTTGAWYEDSVYTLRPIAGVNARQNIALREMPSYEFVLINGKIWMKKNLDKETADSWCYGNSPDSCEKYGRLYTREAAMVACPKGWWD